MNQIDVIRETWLSRKPDPLGAVTASILTFILAFASLIYWNDLFGFAGKMAASNERVFINKEFWRLWTTLFVHADQKHLLSNSFLFFILGTFLTGYFGKIIIPLTAIFFGGLINLVVISRMPLQVQLIGASGVVFWMGGAWLTLYFFLDRRRTLYQRSLRSLGVGILLFVPAEAFEPNISYQSHFIGFVFGIAWATAYYFWNKSKFMAAEVHEIIIDED